MARRALVIANNEYIDPSLIALRSPGSDALTLRRALQDPATADFHVTMIRDKTRQTIAEHLETFFTHATEDDLLLLHISSHSVKDDDGELYFAFRNTQLGKLNSTGLDAAFVRRQIERSNSRSIIVILDCCFSGRFSGRGIPKGSENLKIPEHIGHGTVILTASTGMEYAFEEEVVREGKVVSESRFTSAIAHGIASGEADVDHDGWISVQDLYQYAYDRVSTVTREQTPQMWNYRSVGRLYISRTRSLVTEERIYREALRVLRDLTNTYFEPGFTAQASRRYAALRNAAQFFGLRDDQPARQLENSVLSTAIAAYSYWMCEGENSNASSKIHALQQISAALLGLGARWSMLLPSERGVAAQTWYPQLLDSAPQADSPNEVVLDMLARAASRRKLT
jgi:hypothetical protein